MSYYSPTCLVDHGYRLCGNPAYKDTNQCFPHYLLMTHTIQNTQAYSVPMNHCSAVTAEGRGCSRLASRDGLCGQHFKQAVRLPPSHHIPHARPHPYQ